MTNIRLFIFDIDGYGDLEVPLSKKFNMNGVNMKTLNKGDRVCILFLMEKDEQDNLGKFYKAIDMWFEE